MNCKKIYIKIIKNALMRVSLSADEYYEKHHIFPRSIFGDNKYFVSLTLKEHYLVHKILYKYYLKKYGKNNTKTIKMMHALYAMSNRYLSNKQKINCRIYAKLRSDFCDKMSENFSGSKNPMFGVKNIGQKNHFYGKRHSKETRQKMRMAKLGKKQSQETRNKKSGVNHPYYRKKRAEFSEKMKGKYTGENHWSYGKPLTLEQKDNLRKSMIGKNVGKISKFRKKVERIDRNTGEVKEYNSILETSKDGYLPGKVSSCCKGKRETHKGYFWNFIGKNNE
jgi:hypothetical protein